MAGAAARLLDHPGVAVGMGAATVAVLRLPLSAVVIASVLTAKAGAGAEPLVIVGVVVSYVVSVRLSAARRDGAPASDESRTRARAGHAAPVTPAPASA